MDALQSSKWGRHVNSQLKVVSMFVSALAIGACMGSSPAMAAPVAQAYYVSPTGHDSYTGLSPSQAFANLERASAAMRASKIKTTYLMGGHYARTWTFIITAADAGESWLAYPGQTPVLDGGGKLAEGIYIAGSNVTVRWLTLQNFTQTGIFAENVSGVVIDSNTINNTMSNGWNQGAILTMNSFINGRISHNLIQNAAFIGIGMATSPADSISNNVIDSNAVYNTCTAVADCGAIYADDRSHSSKNIVITNNIVGKFGSAATISKGIYMDDLLSNTTVKNNIVYGSGLYALQVHGGDHNLIQNNIFDISQTSILGLYQTLNPADNMNSNVFTCNIVYSTSAPPVSLWADWGTNVAPTDSKNLYWGPNGALPNLGAIVDTQPTTANPGFVNPAAGNYAFRAGAAPSFCGFQPINTAQVGPLPNV
jgi:hypothetical protein